MRRFWAGTLVAVFCLVGWMVGGQQAPGFNEAPDEMVLIPAGSFLMGIDENDLPELVEMGRQVPHMSLTHARWWFGDEIPRHVVEMPAFLMDRHEVTNDDFTAFVEATGYHAEGPWQKYANTADRADHPVVNVTLNDASAYASWAGKRLPAEEEWEYAARGGRDVRWYPWGNTADPARANYRSQGEGFFAGVVRALGMRRMGTMEVGCFPANGYGLYDMIGNVAEWCANQRRPYDNAIAEDWPYRKFGPWGEERGQPVTYNTAVRGGSWESSNPVFIRLTSRIGVAPEKAERWLGFRCVRSLPDSQE